MPELPEVEVIRRQIEPLVKGRTLSRVETTSPSYFFVTPPAALKRGLKGRQVSALERLGKYLLLRFIDGAGLLLHLGMTGQLFCTGCYSPRLLSRESRASVDEKVGRAVFKPDIHTHLVLHFNDHGPSLYFRDARKFGKVQLLRPNQRSARLAKLGVDALRATGDELYRLTRNRKRAIKSLLLDQSLIAGIGNIYADEALFVAGIRPTKRAPRISREQSFAIITAVRSVMQRSIQSGGSSISDYLQPDGRDGGYQDELMVYAREGQPCLRCGTCIKRVVIGGRSARYCPRCQR
ncbi:MAG: bifunctional DNA-formamidopyrimidine glycosylase/DNA-(apurinic or apyrimidinic site) lyase [Deltaproteobacteria bacterium]|nr:bifunctional DNA-formamidopyrimidine glycosylase/DNA-(apurinic or apyrimidinic site) lyase [Deltaproteobacteria bacterium]